MAWARAEPAWLGRVPASALADSQLPSIRLRRTGRKGSGLRTGALMGGIALMALLTLASLAVPPTTRPAEPPVAAMGQPVWRDIDRPFQLFTLAGSAYARLPMDYTARRRSSGDGREDWLTFGNPGHPGLLLRLVVSRRTAVPSPAADLVVDYARLAATTGHAMTRAGLPFSLATRFGGFDTAELTLRRGGLSRACLGFRLQNTDGPIGITGVACNDPDHPPERSEVACALDRIDLMAAGDDSAMRRFFATGSEQRKTRACDGGPAVVKGPTSTSVAPLARGT